MGKGNWVGGGRNSRRNYLLGAGAIAGDVFGAGCQSIGGGTTTRTDTPTNKATDTPTDAPTETPTLDPNIPIDVKKEYPLDENRRYSKLEADAFFHARDVLDFPVEYEDAEGRTQTVEMGQLTQFFHSDTSKAFRDAQLDYWIDIEGWDYYREDVGKRDAKTVKAIVVDGGHLWHDDWDADGRPHILPNGETGPGDTENPAKPGNPDRDGLMDRFFNYTRTVRDVTTGEYLGFQPGEGDKVGKRGDKQGNGSILNYTVQDPLIDGEVTAEVITGHRVEVILWDRAEGATPPDTEWMSELFADAPVENPDGTTGIQLLHIERDPIQQSEPWDVNTRDITDHYHETVPAGLVGPAFYAFIGDTVIGGDAAYSGSIDQIYPPTHGIGFPPPDGSGSEFQPAAAMDLYGELRGGSNFKDGDFSERGWEQIAAGLYIENQPYFSHLSG